MDLVVFRFRSLDIFSERAFIWIFGGDSTGVYLVRGIAWGQRQHCCYVLADRDLLGTLVLFQFSTPECYFGLSCILVTDFV